MSVGPFGVPHETQRVEHLGSDRVLAERVQPDGRTVVSEVCREKPLGRVPEVVVRRHFSEITITKSLTYISHCK